MSLEDLLKKTLKERPRRWADEAALPGVHFDFTADDRVSVVFDGKSVEVRADRVDPGSVGQTFGQAFFEGLCTELAKDTWGSYEDAKALANKVAMKAMRLPHMQAWLVHSR